MHAHSAGIQFLCAFLLCSSTFSACNGIVFQHCMRAFLLCSSTFSACISTVSSTFCACKHANFVFAVFKTLCLIYVLGLPGPLNGGVGDPQCQKFGMHAICIRACWNSCDLNSWGGFVCRYVSGFVFPHPPSPLPATRVWLLVHRISADRDLVHTPIASG